MIERYLNIAREVIDLSLKQGAEQVSVSLAAISEGIWTCGKDGQSVPVGVGLPTVLISEMTVGGM